MLRWLHQPLSAGPAAKVAAGAVLATAVYCFAYNALAGRAESPVAGIVWAGVNVLPWWIGFEAAKRARGWPRRALAIAGALVVSLLLHVVAYGADLQIGFEIARRLPAATAVLAALIYGRHLARAADRDRAPADLSVPSEVAWIRAAGNYVELHGAGRVLLRRASLQAAEASLHARGFIRIHRSTLVRRDRIVRIRPNDVILNDGTSLKLGKRYRAMLA